MKRVCISCESDNIIQLLDLGPQPPSNRFLHKKESEPDKHPLRLGICDACGHVQLLDPMHIEMVRSRFDWVSYNEPEGHLDEVVSNLIALPGITKKSKILGITYKEDTTLDRLKKRGLDNLYRLRPQSDFSISDDSGIEVIQSYITPDKTRAIADNSGQADLVYARHILEHSHNPREFTEALKLLVKDSGYLVFEVPDSEKFMRYLDYPFIWEEHISYFVEQSLRQFVETQNLNIIGLFRYQYTFEDALVVITRLDDGHNNKHTVSADHDHVGDLASNYANQLPQVKDSIRARLMKYIDSGKRIGLFGGGHLAVKYLNFFELSEIVEMVLDDNPHKQGLYMPGSGIPIVNSLSLERLDLCLLSLSPESEKKVLESYHSFLDNGGEFRSIFAGSPISVLDSFHI